MNRRTLSWIPAFLAGAAAATAAELSAGLLLYSGLGFLRALTIVLTVQMLAFALGLWTATGPSHRPPVETVRRRWLFAMIAYTTAAVFAVAWSAMGPAASGRAGQGLGLAVLAGLPLVSVGALLGSMSRLTATGRTSVEEGETVGGPGAVGAAAATGAAAGFLVTGFVFVPTLQPSATLLACVVGLSLGALVHSWILDERETAEVLEQHWTARGEVRVEDRVQVASPRRGRRVLLEGGRVRGSEPFGESPDGSWERGLLVAMARGRETPATALVFGLGTGTLARGLAASSEPGVRVVAVEPNEALARLARAHFPPGRDGVSDPWQAVAVGPSMELDALMRLPGRFDLVVVDTSALGDATPLPPVSPARLALLRHLLEPGGVLLLGALPGRLHAEAAALDPWMEAALPFFPSRRLIEVSGGSVILLGGPQMRDWVPAAGDRIRRWDTELQVSAAPDGEAHPT